MNDSYLNTSAVKTPSSTRATKFQIDDPLDSPTSLLAPRAPFPSTDPSDMPRELLTDPNLLQHTVLTTSAIAELLAVAAVSAKYAAFFRKKVY